MFYKFNINTFNFIVKVGGQRGLVEFFDTAIPDPWSSFSVPSYNELTGIKKKYAYKKRQGLRRCRNPLEMAIVNIAFAKRISASLSLWRVIMLIF
jgi:hypothetical protein